MPPNAYLPIYNSFKFQDADQLQGSPILGKHNTYEGSGYVYELRGQLSYLQGNLSILKDMDWINRQTRAVFVEFSVYNPNINLIMVSTILVEFLPSGSILASARFDPLNLFGETGSGISFKIICEIIFMGFIVYFMVCEVRDIIKRDFKEYVHEFWNHLEWSIIITAWISFGMLLTRMKAAQNVLDFFQKTQGYGYMKLQKVNESNQVLTFSLGLCASLGTIKFLKILRFNRSIAQLGLTLKICFGELASFTVVFFFIWIAFVQLMYLIYGNDLEGYASMIKSMESAFLMMLGKFDATQFILHSPVLGGLIFSTYNVVILCFVLNIFITIITEAFDKIRLEAREKPNEFDLYDILKKIKERLFKKKSDLPPSDEYKDPLSIFPIQVNRLIDLTINVIFNVKL